MSLHKIKIIDQNFSHAIYSTDYQRSKYIEWDRDLSSIVEGEPVFYTDSSMQLARPGRKNIGWLMEPPAISSHVYSLAQENANNFDYILTYSRDLLEKNEKFIFYPHCGCWIEKKDWAVYPKSKNLSIIASNKISTFGHRLRHQIISLVPCDMDVYGRGYNPIPYKLPALQEFRFSYVIENSKIDYYFTEKLIDCLLTGTIPIYFGCPSIGNFFNLDGFILIDSLEDAIEVSKNLSRELYESKIEAINENFQKAKNYVIAEDWFYENYPEITK